MADPSGDNIFQRLLTEVTECYRAVDNVFRHCNVDLSSLSSCGLPQMHSDSSGNLFFRVFGSKVLPFNVQASGKVAWDKLSDCVRPNSNGIRSNCIFTQVSENQSTGPGLQSLRLYSLIHDRCSSQRSAWSLSGVPPSC